MNLPRSFGELFATSLVITSAVALLCTFIANDILARLAFNWMYDNETAFGANKVLV